jgi:hypothetical protein
MAAGYEAGDVCEKPLILMIGGANRYRGSVLYRANRKEQSHAQVEDDGVEEIPLREDNRSLSMERLWAEVV